MTGDLLVAPLITVPLSDYLLMSLAVVAHSCLGRRLGAAGIATASLTGLVASAAVVGILANFFANLITPYILGSVVVLGLGTLYDAVRQRKQTMGAREFSFAALLVLLALALLLINRPEHVFYLTENGQTFLSFNKHYSYFSSQSQEMLAAEYAGRLRMANQYPHEWAAYHFFSSGCVAIIRLFCSAAPTLIGYFAAQLVLFTFVLLSLAEKFFKLPRVAISGMTATGIGIFLCWLAIGLSLFDGSISWLLYSNSVIALWATLLIVWAAVENDLPQMLLMCLVLTVCATRMVPIAGPVAGLICLTMWRLRQPQPRKIAVMGFGALILTYITATFSVPKPEFARFLSDVVLTPVWHHLLLSYRIIGRLRQDIGFAPLPEYQAGGSYLDFFARLPKGSVLGILFSATMGLGAAYIIIQPLIRIRPSIKTLKWKPDAKISTALGIAFIILVFAAMDYRTWLRSTFGFLYIVIFPYLLANKYLLGASRIDIRAPAMKLLALLWSISVLFQLTGANEIKGPVAYTTFDIFTWGLIAPALLCMDTRRQKLLIFGLLAATFFCFPPHIFDMAKMTASPLIDITHYPASLNLTNGVYEDAAKAPIDYDAISSYFGARVMSGDQTQDFISHSFMRPDK
jgi:hypothetical protein